MSSKAKFPNASDLYFTNDSYFEKYNLKIAKTLILLSISLFVSIKCLAQTNVDDRKATKDSLLKIYNTNNGLEKAKASYHLSMQYRKTDKDTALIYAQKAKELSLQTKDYIMYSKSLQRIGLLYFYNDNYQKGIHFFNRAIKIADAENNEALVIDIKNDLGNLYARKGFYEKSLEYLSEAYYYYQNLEASKNKQDAYVNLGVLYFKLKEYDKSRELLKESREIAIQLNDLIRESTSSMNLAIVHAELKEYSDAKKIYKTAIEKCKQDSIALSHVKWNSHNNLALIYFLEKKYDSSLYYGRKTLKIPTENLFDSKISRTYSTIGNAYMGLKRYKEAEENISKSLKIAKEHNLKDVVMYAYEDFYKLYKRQKDFEKSLHFFEKYKDKEKELYNKDFSQEIDSIESSKVIEEKEVAIASLSKEKEADKKEFQSDIKEVIWIASSILILILGVIALFVFRNKARLAENERELSTIKLFALRSQMNPHFIFNAINGVQNFILKAEKLEAYNYLNKFSKAIRLILDNSNTSFVRLQKELDLIEVYVDLEKIRFRDKLEFIIKVSEDALEKNPYIPAMILQPLLENSVIHGISNKPEGGKVTLEIFLKENSLGVIVEDTGIGREAAQKIKQKRSQNFKGISSVNTKQRIEILRKSGYKETSYSMEDLFDESGNPTGTKGIVLLPLKNQYDEKN